jgi:translation initiation factor IF-1
MPDEDSQRLEAMVIEALPNGLYRVELSSAERQHVTAHPFGASGLLRILPGERVWVELSAYDAGRARIVAKKQ